ncbi:phage tail tape measure protein [Streptomyces xanthochromogenes]|uniref:phage tail tape measure protein n=1 Tax=Streptomyces xanthochromogenes TaxID=67384 RepID=UPI002F3FB263
MPNVGYATLQIIPSVRGIGDELRRQLVGPSAEAGSQAGEEAGGGFKDKLLKGIAVAGAAAGALVVAGLNEAIDQANVTSTLQAQLGATAKDASRYGKVAGELYSKGITESFAEGAEAIRSVVNAGLVKPDATNAQLESIAAKMSDVATTFGTDMSLQTQAVSALMKNGLAPSAESALDVITTGLQKLGPNAEDLLETFQEYPVQLKKLGLDSKTALGLFSQGLQGGARDTDIVADALKEFSIRSIDMSASSRAAYKSLGLDAETLEKQIGKGGASATAGLQTVLDKLRGIHDPVQRESAAVGLFGTQAEELGTALFKLDPKKAVGTFSKIGGAAAGLGLALHSGPSYEIEVFKRTLQQNFVEFIGGKVLPTVSLVATGLRTLLLPPLLALSTVLEATVVPTITALWQAGGSVVQWLKDMGTWLIPIGIAVTGFTLALTAQAIATGIVTGVFSVYRAAILAWTAVQRGATIAQAAFNLVMNANPVILVITAILALGAALVVAYQRSDTFRAIVQAAWLGIQTAASYVWENVLKPVFAALVTAFNAVAAVATWLWQNILSPIFSFIGAAAQIMATVVITLAILPAYFIFKLLGTIVSWLWTMVISPVFSAIGALALWLWNNAVKPAFTLFIQQVQAVATVVTWLWRNAVQPAFQGIGYLIGLWWTGVKIVFQAVIGFITGPLAGIFRWLWNNVVTPIWNGIKATIAFVWTNGIKPVFDALSRGVGTIRDSFNTGVSAIGRIWNGLKDIARKPVQFIVDTVYNNGIRKVWNTVADFTGAGKLDAIKFAGGGRTFGGTPGVDSIPALMMADEYVIKRDSARSIGFGALDYMNRTGQVPGFARGGKVQRFKDGGVVGWLKGAASSVGDFFGDAADILIHPGKAWDTATKFIRDKLSGIAGGGFGKLVAGIPLKMLSSLKDKITSVVGSVGGLFGGGGDSSGGSGVTRWTGVVQQALRMLGQPAGYTGITLRRMNQESGGNPTIVNKWDSNWLAGTPSVGLMQVIGPTFDSYAGAMRGVGPKLYGVSVDPLANVYASMRYALAQYGSLPSAYNRAGGYDSGGWLMPGVTTAVNKTGQPEAVLTGPQWQAMKAAASAGADGLTIQVFVGNEEISHIARTEVRRANGELVQVLNAGGGL